MWLGSQNLSRILLHAAIPKPACEFSLQSSEHAKLQAYVYVLLKSKGFKEHPYILCQTEVFNLFLDLHQRSIYILNIFVLLFIWFYFKNIGNSSTIERR